MLGAIFLALCISQAGHAVASAVKPNIDLLTRPAVANERVTTSVLLAVANAGERLVAVGERGIILLTDDIGKSWRQARVPVSVALTDAHFPQPDKGWAIGHGGVVLHSADGGASWVKQLDGRQAAMIEQEEAKAEAARSGEEASRRLRDAERLVAEGADKPFLAVHFTDAKHGLVVGAYGLAFATADGGNTWQSLKGRIDNPRGRHLYGIHADGKSIYLAGEQGAFYHSEDGGLHFREVKTPYAGTFFGVFSGSHGELIVYGLRGNIYRSMDHGVTWNKVETGLPVTLTGAARLASGALVLVDETGRVLLSDDNGVKFKVVPVSNRSAFTGVAQAGDGSLVMSGVRGPVRVEAEVVLGGLKK